ncbi:MAG: hypothetical protein U0667_17170, partial [Chloroflexota bacterium]
LASARSQAESALAGCAFCGRPHKDPDPAMHAPVPYVLDVPASEMLELLDEAAAAREALPSVEEMTAALVRVGGLHTLSWVEYAEAILAALRAARASDGGR